MFRSLCFSNLAIVIWQQRAGSLSFIWTACDTVRWSLISKTKQLKLHCKWHEITNTTWSHLVSVVRNKDLLANKWPAAVTNVKEISVAVQLQMISHRINNMFIFNEGDSRFFLSCF